jgi:hypothetical protein
MAITRGGDMVRGGYYWNMQKWDATFVEGKEGALPGSAKETYRRVPVPLLLLGAPIMGALFVMFLPFIGIALLVQQMTRAGMELAGDALERVLMSVSPSWRPGMAFLAGRAAKRRARQHDEVPDETLNALEQEIRERRQR